MLLFSMFKNIQEVKYLISYWLYKFNLLPGKLNIQTLVKISISEIKSIPNEAIEVPKWEHIDINSPIFPGCHYTWKVATKDGQRIPNSFAMGGIIKMALALQKLQTQIGENKQLQILSWYRNQEDNKILHSKPDSLHPFGYAADVYFPGIENYFDEISNFWPGGIDFPSSDLRITAFIHLDLGSHGKV